MEQGEEVEEGWDLRRRPGLLALCIALPLGLKPFESHAAKIDLGKLKGPEELIQAYSASHEAGVETFLSRHTSAGEWMASGWMDPYAQFDLVVMGRGKAKDPSSVRKAGNERLLRAKFGFHPEAIAWLKKFISQRGSYESLLNSIQKWNELDKLRKAGALPYESEKQSEYDERVIAKLPEKRRQAILAFWEAYGYALKLKNFLGPKEAEFQRWVRDETLLAGWRP